ncbi:MAG TPA: YncE family protein [Candidatus Angelobacter sp.]|nr:YncE family protein [Candidatus Angelobacter sp.]
MKSRFQALWISVCVFAALLLAMGCNDTLRQFITPVPPPTGDPGALAHGITLSTNPAPSGNGTDMHIDVSGDSSVGIVNVGIKPVFLGKSGNRIWSINSGDASNPPTVSVYTALLPQSAVVTTVTLPSSPDPNAAVNPVAGGTSSTGNIYIANRGSNNVSVISAGVLAVTTTIPLPAGDSGPVMIAGNAANNQIFVINQTSGTVTQISTIDNTVVSPSITVGSSPVWGAMSSDGLFVFVVNQGSNNVSVIDTSLRTVIATIPVGTSPNFGFYEARLKRLYVNNTGSNTISVIKADSISTTNPPLNLKDVPVSGTPTSVTALSDGSKAYAALGNCPAGINHLTIVAQLPSCTGNTVSVIDAVGLREMRTIPVGTGAVSIDSSADASRVFVVNSHDSVTDASGTHTAGTISDIRTSTDTEVVRKLAPQQDRNCKVSSTVFCATQTPFLVRTFP